MNGQIEYKILSLSVYNNIYFILSWKETGNNDPYINKPKFNVKKTY